MTRRWEDAAKEGLLQKQEILRRRWTQHLEGERQLLEDRKSDPVDMAAAWSGAHSLERLGEAELIELREIGSALERLRVGNYGRCEWCADEIELPRLEVLLWTRSCIECAAEIDRRVAEGTRPG